MMAALAVPGIDPRSVSRATAYVDRFFADIADDAAVNSKVLLLRQLVGLLLRLHDHCCDSHGRFRVRRRIVVAHVALHSGALAIFGHPQCDERIVEGDGDERRQLDRADPPDRPIPTASRMKRASPEL